MIPDLQLIDKVFKVFKKSSLHEKLRYRNSMQNVQTYKILSVI